jgi:hypothetical protein
MVRRGKLGGTETGPEALAKILARSSPEQLRPTSMPLPPSLWRTTVGPRIAQHSLPHRLDHGTLTVHVTSSVWAQELSFLAPTIQKRLQSQGVGVRALRFAVRSINTPELRPQQLRIQRATVSRPAIPPALERALSRIAEPELRRTITRAARVSMGCQEPSAGGATEARPGAPVPRRAGPRSARSDCSPTSSRGGPARRS